MLDAWETVSQSAWTDHVSGQSICTAVVLIRGLEAKDNGLKVTATALALGTAFGPPHERPAIPIVLKRQALEMEAEEAFYRQQAEEWFQGELGDDDE